MQLQDVCFTNLHVHSEFSALDGLCKLEELMLRAKELGQTSIAITDHGSTSALYNAQKLGKKHGIKVIMGTEFYYERENDGKNGHIIVLAKNNEGLKNIFKLQEKAYVENFYKKPRVNFDMLKEHKEGLVIASACLASTFSQLIMNGEELTAKTWAKKFKQEFGEDFYIEIQPNSIFEQINYNKVAINIAKELGIKVIATNDVHYVLKEDSFAHEVLLALQFNKKMSDEKRFKFSTNDFWLKSKEEMFETFTDLEKEDVLNAINNTSEVSEKCNAELISGRYAPHFYNVPKGETERSVLAKEIMSGAKRTGVISNKQYMKDLQHELNVIDESGYAGYMLIVQDYLSSARKNGVIVGEGRGSVAGSKMSYVLDITRLEPTKYNLLFERFMDFGRHADIDSDVSDQDAVFKDLQQKYGEKNVARIIAFGTLAPRAVTRKVLSAFEHSTQTISKITKLIPELCKSIDVALESSEELRKFAHQNKVEFDVIKRLEGTVSHESQHAGGVVIYNNLSDYMPIITRSEDRNKRIVGFDKYMVEEYGFIKFDILGLETLPVIKLALDYIKQTDGIDVDLQSIDENDKNVYDLLCSGSVEGVFQLSNQMQKVVEQQPRNFKDLIAINALLRPGVGKWEEYIARRKGKPWKIHELRMPYMKETEGTIAYQEQILLDCHVFAGWAIGYADSKVRKNKNIKADKELKEKFYTDVQNKGHSIDLAKELWGEIEQVIDGGYSFNASHSASYAKISLYTAWLKANYPRQFYASLMTAEKTDGDGQSAISSYVTQCKTLGIQVLPPNINTSGNSFTVSDKGIGYRLTAISNLGETAIKNIIKNRPYTSFEEFVEKRSTSSVSKKVITNLIKAGAFDSIDEDRATLMWKFDMMNRTKTKIKNEFVCEQYEYNDKIKSQWEYEALGLYLTAHPLEKYGFNNINTFPEGGVALQGGQIYDIKETIDKNGNKMAFIFINTLFGNIKTIAFASTWRLKKIQSVIQKDNIVMVKGGRSGNDILISEVELLGE